MTAKEVVTKYPIVALLPKNFKVGCVGETRDTIKVPLEALAALTADLDLSVVSPSDFEQTVYGVWKQIVDTYGKLFADYTAGVAIEESRPTCPETAVWEVEVDRQYAHPFLEKDKKKYFAYSRFYSSPVGGKSLNTAASILLQQE
ncbi:MAG: hypothetical protein ACI9X4_000934 [Glaciecola sp.]|jgi:hypothetical protein